MDELISRKAAIDAVDTIGHIATMPDGDKCIRRSSVKYVLSMLPSAQPEIIHCRECKFASGDSRICMKSGYSPIGELDFCAWAERKSNE